MPPTNSAATGHRDLILNDAVIDVASGKPDLEFEARLSQRKAKLRKLPQPTFESFRSDVDKNAAFLSMSWLALAQLFDEHKDLIKTKWRKMTKVKRKELLKSVTSSLPLTHRPDIRASETSPQTPELQDAYIVPSLNYEDLCEGDTFLLLLSSRVRYQPEMFAHKDLYESRFGVALGCIFMPVIEGYTMLLDKFGYGVYGRLLAWDDNGVAQALLKSGKGFEPALGALILEKQRLILNLLLASCVKLMPDPHSSFEKVVSDMQAWFGNPGSSIRSGPRDGILMPGSDGATLLAFIENRDEAAVENYLGSTRDFPSLDKIVREAPYRVPANVSFLALHALAEARFTAAEDHVWSLREDPAYFLETTNSWVEHSTLQVLDAHGHVHEDCKTHRIWDTAIGQTVADSYNIFLHWEVISQHLQKLSILQSRYASTLNPRTPLPQDYLIVILTLRRMILELSEFYRSQLKDLWPASPLIRSSFIRLEVRTVESRKGVPLISKEEIDASKRTLIKLFDELSCNRMIRHVGLPLLMDDLEHLLKDPTQKMMISDQVQIVLSDLGLIAHLLDQVETYFPWAATMKADSEIHKIEIDRQWSDFSRIGDHLAPADHLLVGKHVMPPKLKFYYPCEMRTKERVESMQKAEKKLHTVWSMIDGHFVRHSGKSLVDLFHHRFKNKRQLCRTPDWVDPPRLTIDQSQPQPVTGFIPANRLAGVEAEKTFQPVHRKHKVKTKGRIKAPDSQDDGAISTLEDSTTEQISKPRQLYLLPRRAYRVFTILFHVPNQSDQPGQLAWNDFLYAMAEVGFEYQKLMGSHWHFIPPPQLISCNPIQFHEPHGGRMRHGKMDYYAARRIGARLGRTYGWDITCFEVEK